MIAVLFEVTVQDGRTDAYLDTAARLRPLLAEIDGFISMERFQSLSQPGKLLSLSWWRDAAAVEQWRKMQAHRAAQRAGRESIFADYRVHITQVMRAYGMNDREGAPQDSREFHAATASSA